MFDYRGMIVACMGRPGGGCFAAVIRPTGAKVGSRWEWEVFSTTDNNLMNATDAVSWAAQGGGSGTSVLMGTVMFAAIEACSGFAAQEWEAVDLPIEDPGTTP